MSNIIEFYIILINTFLGRISYVVNPRFDPIEMSIVSVAIAVPLILRQKDAIYL